MDTASPSVTVAIHDATMLLAQSRIEGAMAHGERLIPLIAQVASAAGVAMGDITDVAVGVGPGPYTGLRVGVVTALTLADALGAELHGVCSLDILAAECDESEFIVMTDARRKEVYWAHYAEGKRVHGPDVGPAEQVAARFPGVGAFGRGARLYADVVTQLDGPDDPRAALLAVAVAEGSVPGVAVEPLYLRRPDATPQARAKRA